MLLCIVSKYGLIQDINNSNGRDNFVTLTHSKPQLKPLIAYCMSVFFMSASLVLLVGQWQHTKHMELSKSVLLALRMS